MTEQSQSEAAPPPEPRRPRFMRPYEWTHTGGDFPEWLHRQGFSEDNWDPQAWAAPAPGENDSGAR